MVAGEELVRVATAEMIRDLGHDVEEAASGSEALDSLESGVMVDVLVTDYMMPGMDGGELARRVKLDYQIPVLLITGYTGTGEDLPNLPTLAKPFSQADLAAALSALMDGDDKVVRLATRRDPGK